MGCLSWGPEELEQETIFMMTPDGQYWDGSTAQPAQHCYDGAVVQEGRISFGIYSETTPEPIDVCVDLAAEGDIIPIPKARMLLETQQNSEHMKIHLKHHYTDRENPSPDTVIKAWPRVRHCQIDSSGHYMTFKMCDVEGDTLRLCRASALIFLSHLNRGRVSPDWLHIPDGTSMPTGFKIRSAGRLINVGSDAPVQFGFIGTPHPAPSATVDAIGIAYENETYQCYGLDISVGGGACLSTRSYTEDIAQILLGANGSGACGALPIILGNYASELVHNESRRVEAPYTGLSLRSILQASRVTHQILRYNVFKVTLDTELGALKEHSIVVLAARCSMGSTIVLMTDVPLNRQSIAEVLRKVETDIISSSILTLNPKPGDIIVLMSSGSTSGQDDCAISHAIQLGIQECITWGCSQIVNLGSQYTTIYLRICGWDSREDLRDLARAVCRHHGEDLAVFTLEGIIAGFRSRGGKTVNLDRLRITVDSASDTSSYVFHNGKFSSDCAKVYSALRKATTDKEPRLIIDVGDEGQAEEYKTSLSVRLPWSTAESL